MMKIMEILFFQVFVLLQCITITAQDLGDLIHKIDDIQYHYDLTSNSIINYETEIHDCYDLECYQNNSNNAGIHLSNATLGPQYAINDIKKLESDLRYLECNVSTNSINSLISYFRKAQEFLINGSSNYSLISYSSDMSEIKEHNANIQVAVQSGVQNMQIAIQYLDVIKQEIENCKSKNEQSNNQESTSCVELSSLVTSYGALQGSVSNFAMGSAWLKTVEAFSYGYETYVIAEIKESKYSYSSQSYIFCGIPSSNWSKFKNGGYLESESYGERFHDYIFDYKCDCY